MPQMPSMDGPHSCKPSSMPTSKVCPQSTTSFIVCYVREVAKLLLDHGADPTVAALNGCTALDLATLTEDTDTELLRLLAKHSIELAPPSITFGKSALAVKGRSSSTTALDNLKAKEDGGGFGGIKAWWGRVSGR